MQKVEVKTTIGKRIAVLMMALAIVVCMAVPAFCADDDVMITAAMMEPVLAAVKANLAVILPIGIGLFAIMLGVRIIPRIFHAFVG